MDPMKCHACGEVIPEGNAHIMSADGRKHWCGDRCANTLLHVWFDNEINFVIAASAEDAAKVYVETGGYVEGDDPPCWEQWDDERSFTTHYGPIEETKICGEWAAERGRSYLACTEEW